MVGQLPDPMLFRLQQPGAYEILAGTIELPAQAVDSGGGGPLLPFGHGQTIAHRFDHFAGARLAAQAL